MNLFIKYSLQQQIYFNGNVSGNKCCRCNESSPYFKMAKCEGPDNPAKN